MLRAMASSHQHFQYLVDRPSALLQELFISLLQALIPGRPRFDFGQFFQSSGSRRCGLDSPTTCAGFLER